MGLAVLILTTLCVGAIIAGIIYIAYLSIKKLKELIAKRREKNAKQQVAFGKSSKILEENAREIINSAPSMTMKDLEDVCDENPYFVVNYDPETDEIDDFQTIRTDDTDVKVDDIVKEKGIMIFN